MKYKINLTHKVSLFSKNGLLTKLSRFHSVSLKEYSFSFIKIDTNMDTDQIMDIYKEFRMKSVNEWNSDDRLIGMQLLEIFYEWNDWHKFMDLYCAVKLNITNDIEWHNLALKMFENNDRWDEGLKLFWYDMKNKNEISYQIALNLCVKLNDHLSGQLICNDIVSNGLDTMDLKMALMKYYSKMNDIEKTLEIFNSIDNKHSIFYNTMMECYSDHEMYNQVISLFDSQDLLDEISHCITLDACIKSGNKEKAAQIVDSMTRHDHNNINTKSMLIKYYSYIGNINKSIHIFDSIKNKDKMCYIQMMRSYNSHEIFAPILRLYFNDNIKSFKDETIYDLVLTACIGLNDKHAGHYIINDILRDYGFKNTSLLNCIIKCYGVFDDMIAAKEIFDNIEHKSIDTYNTLIGQYHLNEMYQEVIDTFYEIKNEFKNVDTYCIAIDACGRIKNNIDGNNIISTMPTEFFDNENIIHALVVYYGDIDEIENSEKYFKKVNIEADADRAGSIMQVYRLNSDLDKSIQTYVTLRKQGIKPSIKVYSVLLVVLGKAFKCIEGNHAINELYIENDGKILNHITVQNSIMMYYGYTYDIRKSREVFDSYIDKHRDFRDILYTYSQLMKMYTYCGNPDEIFSLLDELKLKTNGRMNTHVYNVAIVACTFGHYVDECMKIYNELTHNETKPLNPILLYYIIECLSKNGDVTKAENIYNKWSYLRITYKYKITMLRTILNGCRVYNDVDRGERIFNIINMLAKENNDITDRSCYLLLSHLYWQNKQYRNYYYINKLREIENHKTMSDDSMQSKVDLTLKSLELLHIKKNDKIKPSKKDFIKAVFP